MPQNKIKIFIQVKKRPRPEWQFHCYQTAVRVSSFVSNDFGLALIATCSEESTSICNYFICEYAERAIWSYFVEILLFIMVSFQLGLLAISYINTSTFKLKSRYLRDKNFCTTNCFGIVSAWISIAFQWISLYYDWNCCIIGGSKGGEKIDSTCWL